MSEPDKKHLTFEDDEVQMVTGGLATDVWLPEAHKHGHYTFTGPREFFIINGGHDPNPNTQYGGGLILTVKAENTLGRDSVQVTAKGDTVYCRYFPDKSAWIIAKL